jgi:hypothetical protein
MNCTGEVWGCRYAPKGIRTCPLHQMAGELEDPCYIACSSHSPLLICSIAPIIFSVSF